MRRPLSYACLIALACVQAAAVPGSAADAPRPTRAVQEVLHPSPQPSRAPAHPLVFSTPCLDGPAIEGNDMVSMYLNYGYTFFPPDPNCAAGPTHVISATNGVIQWRPAGNPQDTPEFEQPLAYFFGLVDSLTGSAYTTDPKIMYDQYADRFVLVLLQADPLPILLAISKTSDPNDGWWRFTIPSSVTVNGITSYADYPGLAIDAQAIYLTADMFTSGGSLYGPYLWIIRKAPGGYNGPDGFLLQTPYNLTALGLAGSTAQPAHMFGAVPPGALGAPFGTFIASYGGLSTSGVERIRVVSIDDPLGSAGGPFFTDHQIACGDIDDTAMSTTAAPQLGSTTPIHSNDRRVYNAVWRDNSLYLSANCVPPSGPDAGQVTTHWWRVRTNFDGANTPVLSLADQGDIGAEDLGAGTCTFDSAIMVDGCGNMAVGFAASGPAIYPGAYFAVHAAGDPPGTVGPTCVLAPGLDSYVRESIKDGRNRWGDFTGLALAPDDHTFWIFNEYAGIGGYADQLGTIGQGLWYTKLGKFQVCVATGVAITSFDATPAGGAVVLRGTFRSDLGVTAVHVYRGSEGGALMQIATATPDGSGFHYTDGGVIPGSTYRYRIGAVDADGEFYSPVVTVSLDRAHTALAQNQPNPFNPVTEIPFSIGVQARVSLDVFDAEGRLVRNLVDGIEQPGMHTASWDGRDARGNAVASGVYFCRLRAGTFTSTRRMVLLK